MGYRAHLIFRVHHEFQSYLFRCSEADVERVLLFSVRCSTSNWMIRIFVHVLRPIVECAHCDLIRCLAFLPKFTWVRFRLQFVCILHSLQEDYEWRTHGILYLHQQHTSKWESCVIPRSLAPQEHQFSLFKRFTGIINFYYIADKST